MSKEQTGIFKAAWENTVRKSISAVKKKKKKRVKSLVVPMSVNDIDDDDVPVSEILFPNGDLYTGHCLDGVPHANGKYRWTDGCMYVGDWSSGKMLGAGIFTWPSGATFHGDFKSGFMDGKGTYTGPSGDTYKGDWHMNLKHGKGVRLYPNGDNYDGDWRRDLQHGHGLYQWKCGTHYTGQWKCGAISGTGTMVWVNGNSYDGDWDDGLPRGNGTFRRADGSSYTGVWSKDPEEMSVTRNEEWEPREVYEVELKEHHISEGETFSILPSQKVMMIPVVRVSVDGRGSNCSIESDGDIVGSLENGKMKKQGKTIAKGHKNYELMLNLQLGIRHAVGRTAAATSLDLKPSAFDPREKVWTRFPPEGSKNTPPHPSTDFRWKDYCPLVFRTLRKLFKVDAADYMISLCGDDALRELSSPGKSGSFFYLTNDDKYMIKTMRKAEAKVLIRMLPAYYNHVRAFENTLVTKFFGLHCVKLTGPAQKKVRFVIMGNLFCSEYNIERRFDLKGSSHGRITDKPESEIDATTTLKDLDLNYIFRLHKIWHQEFTRQVDRDCEFLEQERIMDYSLLIGLQFRETLTPPPTCGLGTPTSGFQTPTGLGELDIEATPPRPSRVDTDNLVFDPSRCGSSIRLGINMPVRVELTVRPKDCATQLIGEPTGDLSDVVLFFGIIDILQDYDISKKLEHAYKSIQHDPTSISAVDPKQYSKRFRDFMFKVFIEDT